MSLPLPVAEQIMLQLKLFEPGRVRELGLTLTTADCGSETVGLLLDLRIVQWFSFSLLISGPVDQGTLNIWKLVLGFLGWACAAIDGVQILFLLTENFGDSATRKMRKE